MRGRGQQLHLRDVENKDAWEGQEISRVQLCAYTRGDGDDDDSVPP